MYTLLWFSSVRFIKYVWFTFLVCKSARQYLLPKRNKSLAPRLFGLNRKKEFNNLGNDEAPIIYFPISEIDTNAFFPAQESRAH